MATHWFSLTSFPDDRGLWQTFLYWFAYFRVIVFIIKATTIFIKVYQPISARAYSSKAKSTAPLKHSTERLLTKLDLPLISGVKLHLVWRTGTHHILKAGVSLASAKFMLVKEPGRSLGYQVKWLLKWGGVKVSVQS
uniref:Uncharacterized protein n=1 Tax=Bionectria ochroleuca TaxID=29856 RepID=A0A8H7K5U3_BIOOC